MKAHERESFVCRAAHWGSIPESPRTYNPSYSPPSVLELLTSSSQQQLNMVVLTPVLHGLIAFIKPVRFYSTTVIDICVFAAVRFVLRCFRALSDRSPQKESPSGNEKPKENSDCPTTSQVTDLTPEHIPWSCDERIDWFCTRNIPTPHSTINFVQGDQYNITEAPDNMVISQRQLRIRPWKSRMHRGELEGMKVVVKTYGRQDIMVSVSLFIVSTGTD